MTQHIEQSVRTVLQRVGCELKTSRLLLGTLWWFATSLGVWLGLFLLDNLVRFPPGIRFPCTVGAMTLILYGFVTRILRPSLKPQSVERTARLLEMTCGVRDNVIINACQLEAQPVSATGRIFVWHTVRGSLRRLGTIPHPVLRNQTELLRWGSAAGVLLLGWLIYTFAAPHLVGNALLRYVRPLSDIPPAGRALITTVPAQDVVLYEGDDLEVRASVRLLRSEPLSEPEMPVIAWARSRAALETDRNAVHRAVMQPKERTGSAESDFVHVFRDVRESFAFRVFAADTYSSAVTVRVKPLPRLRGALFKVYPPAYTARSPYERPGPPSSVSCLPGSSLAVVLSVEGDASQLTWIGPDGATQFAAVSNQWHAQVAVTSTFPYRVEACAAGSDRSATIARGEVLLEPDLPPRVEFATTERNRYVNPGSTLNLEIQASDDFGIQRIVVTSRKAEESTTGLVLKEWAYTGPPGRAGSFSERFSMLVSADRFQPGTVHVLEAQAYDFSPGNPPGKSPPLVIRVKAMEELSIAAADPLAAAFGLLRTAIEEQRRALTATENLRLHLAEALAGNTLPAHRKAMSEQQSRARDTGRRARDQFGQRAEGRPYQTRLTTLCDGEMDWAVRDIGAIETVRTPDLEARITRIADRQTYIINELLALLGHIAADRGTAPETTKTAKDEAQAPNATAEDAARLLRDELKQFAWEQKRILDKTRTLADKKPEDLTEEEERILGQLAREEAEWAQFFEERLTDFSKLPLQDFADKSLAAEFNEVYQEVKLAAKSLYERKIEMAVPQEQAGLERADKLVHNLERWLSDIPDNLKWLMEEPPAAFDVPLAELPAELEDIVGELLDREQEMGDDVEDVTSSWLDSLDKGAGWTAMDGPISDMSAKGVTGNLLPNQQEVGGRAGEGRTGRSHGQMVEETAEGKDGRETPTRLTPSPFEAGTVEDSSRKGGGGATGGGKLSGFDREGLKGPAPIPRLEKMARLADQQTQIRQDAEALTLRLRAYNLPSGDLESAIGAMKRVEKAARSADGLGLRTAYSLAVDALHDARKTVHFQTGLHRERSKLSAWEREQILVGLRDASPRGYEEMVAAYFRLLAEQSVVWGGQDK